MLVRYLREGTRYEVQGVQLLEEGDSEKTMAHFYRGMCPTTLATNSAGKHIMLLIVLKPSNATIGLRQENTLCYQ